MDKTKKTRILLEAYSNYFNNNFDYNLNYNQKYATKMEILRDLNTFVNKRKAETKHFNTSDWDKLKILISKLPKNVSKWKHLSNELKKAIASAIHNIHASYYDEGPSASVINDKIYNQIPVVDDINKLIFPDKATSSKKIHDDSDMPF